MAVTSAFHVCAYLKPRVPFISRFFYVYNTINRLYADCICIFHHVTGFVLCMSQLSVGLYAFKVTVSGENAFGEGFVNVTVKPGKSAG